MQRVPIVMPQLGESIAEATVIEFLAAEGAVVKAGQEIIEVETNKAAMNVTAPASGLLKEYTATVDESYAVGAILGYIETGSESPESSGADKDQPADSSRPKSAPESPAAPNKSGGNVPREVKPTVGNLPVPAESLGVSYLSPRLKARMQELGLRSADLAGIAGSGAGGRVTIQDFEKFIAELDRNKLSEASSMRVAVADAMRRSWTRPLVTAGLPVVLDVTTVNNAIIWTTMKQQWFHKEWFNYFYCTIKGVRKNISRWENGVMLHKQDIRQSCFANTWML